MNSAVSSSSLDSRLKAQLVEFIEKETPYDVDEIREIRSCGAGGISGIGFALRLREKYPDDDAYWAKRIEYDEIYHSGDIICINCGYQLNVWQLRFYYQKSREASPDQHKWQYDLNRKLDMDIAAHVRGRATRTATRGVECRFMPLQSAEGRKTAKFCGIKMPNIRETLRKMTKIKGFEDPKLTEFLERKL